MSEPPRKKMNVGGSFGRNGGAGSLDVGSAIVFWHEAEGSPPAVRAISLRDLEPLNGNSVVTEKTICKARYRGIMYHCIVIWIEEDKTVDELASMRLFPATSERTYEDKGYSWAAELGLIHVQKPQTVEEAAATDMSVWIPTDAGMSIRRSKSWDSRSEIQEDEPLEMDDRAPPNGNGSLILNGNGGGHVNGFDATVDGAGAPYSNGHHHHHPRSRKLKEKVGDLSAQVHRMRETITVLRQQKKASAEAFSSRKHLPTFLNSYDEEEGQGELYGPGSPDGTTPSPTNGEQSGPIGPINEDLLVKMLAQSTWKKALKLGMKATFTTEELLTSVPTERGARMSKNGKKALDQAKLAMVKNTVAKYCEQKEIWQPTNELVHQELGGILFSIREANNPAPKILRTNSVKKEEAKLAGQFHTFRGMSRKMGGAPIRPGFPFKIPTFSSAGASATAMDLSDHDGKAAKVSVSPSPTV